jgi:SAM-dependent methyltransferase
MLAAELRALGMTVAADKLSDGRADLVAFTAKGTVDLGAIATAEDLFVEVAAAPRQTGAERMAHRLLRGDGLERALSVAAGQGLPLPANATYRVVARVRGEEGFRRTELRAAFADAVAHARPRWRAGDPAHVELWVLEVQPGRFRVGLRLTGAARRQHGGRTEERRGALRPTVAAAMTRLAGAQSGTLLDPCCGSGTVVIEAGAAGWTAIGSDIDVGALDVARANVPGGALLVADVRRLPFGNGSVAAVASNLPFGRQFQVGDPRRWYAAALDEMARVVMPGGPVVLLAPRLHPPAAFHLEARFPVQLLGQRTTLWHFHRRT